MVGKSLLGWKELEYEVVSDAAARQLFYGKHFENFDPLGAHTGDSSYSISPLSGAHQQSEKIICLFAILVFSMHCLPTHWIIALLRQVNARL